MKKSWHEDESARKSIGDNAENKFSKQVMCHCGGKFKFIGDIKAGFPDFTCENCGQFVDIKSSPQSERTGNLAVSAVPWKNYPEETLLATYIGGKWIGEYKLNITVKNANPYEPTHHSKGNLKNTKFHLVSWKNFRTLDKLGYKVSN